MNDRTITNGVLWSRCDRTLTLESHSPNEFAGFSSEAELYYFNKIVNRFAEIASSKGAVRRGRQRAAGHSMQVAKVAIFGSVCAVRR